MITESLFFYDTVQRRTEMAPSHFESIDISGLVFAVNAEGTYLTAWKGVPHYINEPGGPINLYRRSDKSELVLEVRGADNVKEVLDILKGRGPFRAFSDKGRNKIILRMTGWHCDPLPSEKD